MTDFSDSPSGLDPKTMKPWADMTEAERLEYGDLIARRARTKYLDYQLRQLAEDQRQSDIRAKYHVYFFCLLVVLIAYVVLG